MYNDDNTDEFLEQTPEQEIAMVEQAPEIFEETPTEATIDIPAKKSKKKKRIIIIVIIFLSLFAVVIAGFAINIKLLFGKGWFENLLNEFTPHSNITIQTQDKPHLSDEYFDKDTGLYTPQGIAKEVMPSVVTITVYVRDTLDSLTSQGSGIILTENGYIITNAHVVGEGDNRIIVTLSNGEIYSAIPVGVDKLTDLAVIKITETGLHAADFGNSSQVELGEEIIALGSPAGLSSTLTRGVVSGLNRMIQTDVSSIEMNCIQFDAAINPGNSGGALVNMYGQVIGVVTSKFDTETYDGIGFAIAFNEAKPILEKLIEQGNINDRIRIGIVFNEITPYAEEVFGAMAGLYVQEIDETCDIAKSGLEIGDTITYVEGKLVYTRADVMKALEDKKPGDTATATVVKGSNKDDTIEITFKLEKDISMELK